MIIFKCRYCFWKISKREVRKQLNSTHNLEVLSYSWNISLGAKRYSYSKNSPEKNKAEYEDDYDHLFRIYFGSGLPVCDIRGEIQLLIYFVISRFAG